MMYKYVIAAPYLMGDSVTFGDGFYTKKLL